MQKLYMIMLRKLKFHLGSGGGPPILEKKSFVFMADYVARLQQTPNLIERDNLVKQMKNDLELGLSTSSAGRYLTTRGRFS